MPAPMMDTYAPPDLNFERGEGVRLITDKGDKYLDFISGIAVNCLGHAHPKAVAALTEQAGKLWHLSNMFRVPAGVELAKKLTDATFADRVFFTNSGAEAMECALKTARRYHFVNGNPQRYRIITFTGAFHGRTYGAINAGGNPKYLEGFGPAMEGFDQVEFGDHEALKAAITEETAAICIEPVQGEGGVRAVPEACLRGIRELADEHGILVIYDEVQSGAGRTGKLFAHQWVEGAEPDIMASAKGIGGGFPMGACLATEAAAEGMVVGTHGSTYGGGPLAMAVGNVVFDELTADGFMDQVNDVANFLRQQLHGLLDRHADKVEEVRGKGLLIGIKLKAGYDPKKLAGLCRDRHLLVGAAGDNVSRMAPPLVITQDDASEAVAIMDEALGQLEAS
ncbi:MAG: aspartate aminotransferase family protein [Maricaulis sp.]|uniref:aspartate aminotransferase family protein n=1 Tax=Maricaulis sp. TaxID=1486257 RepID=UPI001B2B3BD2|nr:aspartate aminotransferase family protein [Maricaulis sp.]MBO6846945.1 aspartate aminotransferase family protein [Maricaulis sp.]MBO6876304.1 aspartate aminotransferase family protein [Maricaulis sp.]MDM7984540.1 aspartate aminotransferase family protein [Maricaulis sp.]